MDLFRLLEVSASGLSAQRARMEVIGENLANSDSVVTAGGGPYRRKVVVLQGAAPGGFPLLLDAAGHPEAPVRVAAVVEAADPPRRIHQPGHPLADAEGFVVLPNVNVLAEMLDLLLATRAYEANAAAFQAARSMGVRLIELLR